MWPRDVCGAPTQSLSPPELIATDVPKPQPCCAMSGRMGGVTGARHGLAVLGTHVCMKTQPVRWAPGAPTAIVAPSRDMEHEWPKEASLCDESWSPQMRCGSCSLCRRRPEPGGGSVWM